ncbi:hypothetical protein [Flavobacterium sp.]|uniref:hypothetical protein n=1 Tax=Flavobacterium sp. TaxID=239 RepID=UPI003751BED9
MAQEIMTRIETKSNLKIGKLILSIIFDLVGMLSYVFPGIAETTDVIWAPISGMLLVAMYKGTTGKVAGVIGTLEELIPFTDIIPTFTITWFYENYLDKKNNK